MPGTGDIVHVPKSRSLRELLEWDGMSSLAERALGWKAAAPASSASGDKRKAAQPSGAAKAKAKKSKNTSGVGFSPRNGRAGRRGTAMPAAATDASTTTSTASPTQPVLPHPPPHQVTFDSSSRLSSRSSNRSSNLNSSPSSSSSRRRPRGAGFSSQALPTSAGLLGAVGEAEAEAEADVEAPTRGAAAPGDAVSDSQGSANRQSRRHGGGGRQNERVPCSQTQGGPWDLAVHPSLGKFLPALFHGEKERLNKNCSIDSRSRFNSQMPYDILPQNATTESREVRVLDTSHLTRPGEIPNSLALAADQAVRCRKVEIFSAGKTIFRSSRRTVAEQF